MTHDEDLEKYLCNCENCEDCGELEEGGDLYCLIDTSVKASSTHIPKRCPSRQKVNQ